MNNNGKTKTRTVPVKQHRVPRKANVKRKIFMVSLCLLLVFIGFFGAALRIKTAHNRYVYTSYPLK